MLNYLASAQLVFARSYVHKYQYVNSCSDTATPAGWTDGRLQKLTSYPWNETAPIFRGRSFTPPLRVCITRTRTRTRADMHTHTHTSRHAHVWLCCAFMVSGACAREACSSSVSPSQHHGMLCVNMRSNNLRACVFDDSECPIFPHARVAAPFGEHKPLAVAV